jgi:hypothetical protein
MEDIALQPYYQAIKQLKDSIEDCMSKGRVLSCLTLLYSAIDIFASLERQPNEGTRTSFMRWADAYMLPNNALQFSSIDLYAARCGIIHAFSAESDLSRNGKARKIVYAWGTASAESLREAGQALGRNEVSVHVRDLIDGFGVAIVRYISDVVDHPVQHQRFFQSVRNWLVGVPPAIVDELLTRRNAAIGLAPEA